MIGFWDIVIIWFIIASPFLVLAAGFTAASKAKRKK